MKGITTMRKNILNSLIFSGLLLGIQLPAYAAQGSVEVKSIAEMEVKTIKNGKTEIKRVPVKSAPPEAEIIYTTTFKNIINKPVGNIAISNPVPNDTAYKAGSAIGENTDISYSVDGGKTFGMAETLKVKGKDGKDRPALPAEYTTIRWVYKGELGAGKSGEVSFRTVIK